MIANLSYLILWLALACALYAVVMAGLSVARQRPAWLEIAHRAALLTWPLVTLAMGGAHLPDRHQSL